MSIQEVAIEQINTTKDVYLRDPNRMFSEYNGEKENVKNYNGRQLLEMLQNAEDAASKAKGKKKVLIKLQKNQLIIANTGHPFSEKGLNSIFLSHLSPKRAAQKQEKPIGNKGLGFRSILSWANKVTIKSHDLCVAFSKEYSKKVLDELLTKSEFASKYNKYNKQTKEAPISTLVCPEIIAVDANKYAAYSGYDTIILIDLKETAIKEVIPQIKKDIDGEVLIFLNHLECIELNINGVIKKYNKEKALDSRVKLTTIENGVTQTARFWNINTLSGHFEDINRDYQLSVAWKDELDEKKDVIYSHFRTKVPFHFFGILHGTFELNADRNDISDEEAYNKKLIGLVPGLIANTAEKIANKETQVNYKALSFTIFENYNLPNIIQKSDFEDKLEDALQTKKIFPTICNEYISSEDKPVYYEQDVFAKLLPKDIFPNILLYCDDEAIENHLSKFTTYTFQSLCSAISSRIKYYSIEQYASLIKALIDFVDLDEEEDKSKLCLFYDSEFNPLPFNSPIFLPPDGIEYILPSEIGVQIIHPKLTKELMKKLDVDSYNLLRIKLLKFQIRTFDFNEIINILISHYYSKKAKIEDIKKLNQIIYELYKNEKSKPMSLKDKLAVPLITKTNKIEPANKLYFGKKYGCSITETIYSYNENKLVNLPKVYGIDESDFVNWKSYLKWLGVAEFPRKIQVDGTKEFAEYAMKHYDFKIKIDTQHFNNFNEFKNKLKGYSEIKVTSIDDFDLILKNNNSEEILTWLNLDNELFTQIINDKETILSKISLDFHGGKVIKTIDGIKFRNFIKWKLSNTAWLNTKSGIKQSPHLCTTSATITDEFSPLIEKPNIDINATIFRSNNIGPNKVDYLLNVVGVNKTISSFATNTLYSILSKLPEIDPNGKKAKALYRELAANYEVKNLDTSDAEYKRFLSKGMVFCKKKGENSYEKANTVFYVENKRYGEIVTNQFFTLEVERRKGKTKIKKLFGVKPLEDLKLNLIDQPNFHNLNLNGRFEQEIEAFKPYVYVFRQNSDLGKEKNLIKDVKFKLVTALSVSLELENENLEFDLSDYEYFHMSDNTVFIKTPEYLDEEKKLKDDVHFCSTIAEVFSDLIDVDTQRQQIRELFSKSTTNRNDIIRAELDDKNLEKLIFAEKKLGITNDPKIQFWRAFVECFPSKKIEQENTTDEVLLEDLKHNFPDASEQISVVFDRINYDNYNEEQSLRLIIELLKNTDLSIEGFNKYVYPSIDISEIYELDFKRIKDEKQREFKQAFYSSFINSEKDKKDFLKGINQYDSIKGNFKNVIDYNIKEDLSLRVQELFQIDLLNVKYDFDIEEIYFSNKTKYEKRAEEEQISRGHANQFLSENQNLESLLHFEDEIENLIISLKEWAPKSSDVSPSSGNGLAKKRLSIGGSAFFYEDYGDLSRQLKTGLDNGDFQINHSKIKIKKAETSDGKNGNGNSSTKNFKKPKKPKEDLGFLGEFFVYNHLRETIKNKESIKWVSAYAKSTEVNLDGKDGKGYDIEYIPNNAKHPRYVEVKVVGWDNAFHITSNEIRHGEMLKRYYEIFLVRNITDPENISIEIIQGPFDYKQQDSFNDNEFFTVVNDSFILKFEKTD